MRDIYAATIHELFKDRGAGVEVRPRSPNPDPVVRYYWLDFGKLSLKLRTGEAQCPPWSFGIVMMRRGGGCWSAGPHGRSPEEEARRFLDDALELPHAARNMAEAIRARFAPLADVELELPPREAISEPPTFDGCGIIVTNPWSTEGTSP